MDINQLQASIKYWQDKGRPKIARALNNQLTEALMAQHSATADSEYVNGIRYQRNRTGEAVDRNNLSAYKMMGVAGGPEAAQYARDYWGQNGNMDLSNRIADATGNERYYSDGGDPVYTPEDTYNPELYKLAEEENRMYANGEGPWSYMPMGNNVPENPQNNGMLIPNASAAGTNNPSLANGRIWDYFSNPDMLAQRRAQLSQQAMYNGGRHEFANPFGSSEYWDNLAAENEKNRLLRTKQV